MGEKIFKQNEKITIMLSLEIATELRQLLLYFHNVTFFFFCLALIFCIFHSHLLFLYRGWQLCFSGIIMVKGWMVFKIKKKKNPHSVNGAAQARWALFVRSFWFAVCQLVVLWRIYLVPRECNFDLPFFNFRLCGNWKERQRQTEKERQRDRQTKKQW